MEDDHELDPPQSVVQQVDILPDYVRVPNTKSLHCDRMSKS